MLHTLKLQFGEALMERLTLVVNHVLNAEPAAAQRLKPHAGRCIQLHFAGWPRLLPPPPSGAFVVTPAGLLEWSLEGVAAPALRVTVDASNPAFGLIGMMTGSRRPSIDVAGDAAFATDLNWLIDNLRWDVEDDLARVVGAAPAHQIARLGRGFARALRAAAHGVDGLVRQRRAGAGDPQSR